MRIDKSFTIDAPQDKVWHFVSSPEKVGLCFPGCQEIVSLGDDQYKATIKVQLGPIKTVFKVDFEETEKRPMEFLSYTSRGEEGNRSSRLKADSTLSFSPLGENQTKVEYASDISLVGRLGKFGLGMMNKKADSMGDEFVGVLRSKIEDPQEAAMDGPDSSEKSGISNTQKVVIIAVTAALLYLIFNVLTG